MVRKVYGTDFLVNAVFKKDNSIEDVLCSSKGKGGKGKDLEC